MKGLPWASRKFWSRIPAPAKRQVHLGIDYGTNTSKIVFRVCGTTGQGGAVLVLRNGSFRIPSRVCITATELLFGGDAKAATDCVIYESLKTRVAAEVSGNPKYYLGPATKLPAGLSAADLAALTVWFLISEGHRAVAAHFNGRMEDVEIGMTLGVPMPFFNDEQLKASFLSIARRAGLFYWQEGLLDGALFMEKARRILEKHPVDSSEILEFEDEDWIRCETEAAIWWLLDSPSVGIGPYAMVDIGAHMSQASLVRIFGKVQTAKRSRVPYGAAAVPVGMDALDRAVAEREGLSGDDCSAPRAHEQSISKASAKSREALMTFRKQIDQCYQEAWVEAYGKLDSNAIELSAWRQQKVFVIGGGSLLPPLFDTFRTHRDQPEPLSVMTLKQPTEVVRADHRKIISEELPFVPVAYGLSKIESFLPHPYCRDPGLGAGHCESLFWRGNLVRKRAFPA
jgi:hypothetical protein